MVYEMYRSYFYSNRKESDDIAIAVLGLTVAYAILILGGYGFHVDLTLALIILGESFVAVFTAFFLHEFAHRQVGRRLGYHTRFQLWPFGLLLAFVTAFIGVLFGAMGAVNIYNARDNRSMGIIAAAGPATNLGLGFIFLAAGLVFSAIPLASEIAMSVSGLNFYLGTFNMIPFGPLDGHKVLSWDFRYFALLFSALLVMTVISFSVFGFLRMAYLQA